MTVASIFRATAALAALALAGCAALAPEPPVVALRLIAFNDFHGHLEAPPFGLVVADASAPLGSRRIAAGGVAHLATAIHEMKASRANTAVVAAGDLVGASPLASALSRDEASVEALSRTGLELSALGNHEFDHGREELERLQGLASYRWLAANVFDSATGKTLFPAYAVREYEGIRVAFVGAVLRSTPRIVPASGIRGLEFRDEAQSVNALVPELRSKGIEAIVLLIHEGGRLNGALDDAACPNFAGEIVDIVKRLDPAVDIVVSGHTHDTYVCRVDGRLVTSAGSYGRQATVIDVTLDRASRDVVAASASTVTIEPGRFPAQPAIEEAVRRAAARAAGQAGRIVGMVEGEFTPVTSAAGESSLGDLVADAQLAATRETAGAQLALMNPGGLRAPLASHRADHAVTFADAYGVQPFGNTLVTITLTGEQLVRALEMQWGAGAGERPRMLQVAGLRYAWDGSRPMGQRVLRESIQVEGRALVSAARYRISMTSFLAAGGDGFAVFTEGAESLAGPLDVTALVDYLRASPRLAGPPEGRIVRMDVER